MAQVDCDSCGQKKEENAACKICQLVTAAIAAATANRGPSSSKFDLPPFTTDQLGGIRTWFCQVEIRLSLVKANTEDEKYNFLVAGLPTEISNRVFDMIQSKPSENPYTTIRDKIIKEFEPTEDQQIQKLLEGMKIGTKKPSAFLREMKTLAKDRVQDAVLRQMLLNQLPPVTSSVLALSKTLTLDELAQAADEGMARETKEVSEISSLNSTEKPDDVISKMIEALEKWSWNRRSRSRNRNFQQRDRSKSRQNDLCWAHKKFGDNARTCRKWCKKYSQKGNAKSSS